MAAYPRLAPFALCFLLATSVMFQVRKTEAAACSGACSFLEDLPCGSEDCLCVGIAIFVGFCVNDPALAAMMIKEHPNLCNSHDECVKKGSGNFCARYPNHHINYGWCFDSGYEALDSFLAMPKAISE